MTSNATYISVKMKIEDQAKAIMLIADIARAADTHLGSCAIEVIGPALGSVLHGRSSKITSQNDDLYDIEIKVN